LALGVDGIYISNHGGRQIDHGIGAVESLREITSLAKGKTTIIVDGGFCRGTDIVKGVAMGADAIGIGRIHCLALAAAGEAGVLRMLELMEDELEIAMGLCGVVSLKELNESFLRPVTPVDIASPYERAFPLLEIPKHRYR
jgi:glycolate oxidase